MSEKGDNEKQSLDQTTLAELFALLVAERIVDNILYRGLSHSTWRDAHVDAYQDLINYRADIVAQVTADLQAYGIAETQRPVAMRYKRVVAQGYTVTRDDGLVTNDKGEKIG